LRPLFWIVAVRIFALVALGASAALYVDYTTPDPTFCGAGSGCAQVRGSGLGYLVLGGMPIPVPLFGLLGFSLLLGVSLIRRTEWRQRWVLRVAVFGGLIALALLLVQALGLGVFCSLCVVADVAAVLAAVAAFAYVRAGLESDIDEERDRERDLRGWAWSALGLLCVAAAFVWPLVRPAPPVPGAVRALYVPGKINVVEFADFECPFCRQLHARLKDLLKPYAGRVNFVRLNLPLEGHPQARGAARAYVCADAQGKGDAMADALFEADELGPAQNRQLAVGMDLEMARFDACVGDPATDRRIDAEAKILKDNDFQGLPTTYVGERQLVGALPDQYFRDALERAASGEQPRSLGAVRFGLLTLGLALGIVAFGRDRKTRRG
jgi:predicted DsbA family dithiol-disulfide isomerase